MPPPSAERLNIPVGDGRPPIVAAAFPLAVTDTVSVDILVDVAARDDISRAIAAGTFAVPHPFHLVPAWLPAPGRVLDLGAHIGTFSLFAAALGHRVVAVEASPYNAVLLRASAERNGFDALRVVSAAVGDAPGTVEFVHAGPYGSVANPVVRAVTSPVPMLRIDDLLAGLGAARLDFVKMDIEGSEVAALRGMADLLRGPEAPPILYESNGHTLNFFGETPQSLMAALESLGYRCHLLDGQRLVPVGSHDVQGACNVDGLALKRPPAHPAWPVSPPLSTAEIVAKLVASSVDPNPHVRAHVGRALARPEARGLLADAQITAVRQTLRGDPDAQVRQAAGAATA